jgi:predicted MFS family arabinose efflux permease
MPILTILALTSFVGALCVRLLDPVVPEISREFGVSAATAALLASAFAFPYAIGQPVLGPLGDAVGKVKVIKIAIAVLAIALALSALAPTYEVLFATRLLGGLAAGGVIPLAFAIVGDRFPFEQRQIALTRVLMAAMLGQLISVIGSGYVSGWFGWRVTVASAAAATVLVLVVTLRTLKPRAGATRHPFTLATVRAGYRQVFANPRAGACFSTVFFEGVTVFGLFPYIAVLLEQRGAGGVREAGFVIAGMGLGGVAFTLAVKPLLARLGGMMRLMRVGGVAAAVGLAAASIPAGWPVQALAFTLLGFGFYGLHNSIQTQVTELAPDNRGAAIALHAFFFFLGQAAGPVLYRVGMAVVGPTASIVLAACILAVLGFRLAARLEKIAHSDVR